jgi:hypothetical protein
MPSNKTTIRTSQFEVADEEFGIYRAKLATSPTTVP